MDLSTLLSAWSLALGPMLGAAHASGPMVLRNPTVTFAPGLVEGAKDAFPMLTAGPAIFTAATKLPWKSRPSPASAPVKRMACVALCCWLGVARPQRLAR